MQGIKSGLLCATALAGALAVGAGSASAQDTETRVDEIVVTGSRISRKDYVAESPIVTVTREQITAVGMTTIENALNQLPQFTPSNGAGTNTTNFVSTPGQAYSNLRGLGPTRTLVLIDGRRVVAGNPNNVVDLNTIPTFLVDSIETITGGASAVYGSDAVAGVVNFKLRRNYEGFQVDAQYGQTDRGDAAQSTLAVTGGLNFAGDRGNLMGAFTYDQRDGLLASDRDWSAIGYSILNTGVTPSGAATIPDGRYDPASNAGGAANLPSQAALDTVFSAYGVAAGTLRPGANLSFNNDGTLFATGGQSFNPGPYFLPVVNYRGEEMPGFSASSYTYNSAPYRYLHFPLERYSLFAAADFDLTSAVELYGTVSFTTYEVSRQLGPASASDGAFPGPDIVVPVTNPFIPADLKTLLDSRTTPGAAFYPRRAFNEVGGRLSQNTYDTLQVVGGARGQLGADWRWDAYLSYGEMNHTEDQFGNVSRAAMRELTFAPDGGVAICGGFNIFGAGKISPGCADYISRDVTNNTTIEQVVAEAYVTGTLLTLPTGPVKASFGLQARNDRFDYDPDALLQGPDIVGFNSAVPVVGEITSREVYGELLIPILPAELWSGALDLNLGGRIADYNTVGQTKAWKADLTWRPLDGLLVRGGVQRAVRAPNIAELFSPQSQGFIGIGSAPSAGDPCGVTSNYRTGANGAAVRQLCLDQGVSLALIDSFTGLTQVETLGGGNPDLREETADSFTAGVVWRSPFEHPLLSRLSASVDYYEIEVSDIVGTVGLSTILGSCFNNDGSNPTYDVNNFYCQQLTRLPSGNIGRVQLTQVNLASLRTTGFDVQIDWGFALADLGMPESAGDLAFNFVYGHIESFERQVRPGAATVDYAGTIGGDLGATVYSGGALPDQKWVLSTTWTIGPVKGLLRWRHLDAMTDARSVPVFNATALNTPDYDIFDAMGSWTIDERLTLRVGVNNIGDKDPPYFSSAANSNTDPSTYDVLGRRFFIGLNARF